MKRDDYAAELTGFEQRLLDGLRAAHVPEAGLSPATPIRPRPPRWRPVLALAATAAAVAAAVIVPATLGGDEPGQQHAAPPVAPASISYVRGIAGETYKSLEGGELTVEVRSDQQVWLSDQGEVRVRTEPYRQASCHATVDERPCDGWLARYAGQLGLTTAPVDQRIGPSPDTASAVQPTTRELLAEPEFTGGYDLRGLSPDPARLDEVISRLARGWYPGPGKPIPTGGPELDLQKRRVLLELAAEPALPPAVRLTATTMFGQAEPAIDRVGRGGTRLTVATAMGGVIVVTIDPRSGALLEVERQVPVPPDNKRPATNVVAGTFAVYLAVDRVHSFDETR
ncbi:hypothetical protein [Amycolatopsis suaedae]|uniref:CU044_5270 family protein n=1 Tax=Amycolatopsis suaedae TaxID=2510978 RepID=A0A4Q7J7J7_9PSEU|nr:hypothetical protein [Amycolatopsis suaedae]RZQ62014.1 hypothetical protein EWH70_20680 [Amycolatopsis suaedae]